MDNPTVEQTPGVPRSRSHRVWLLVIIAVALLLALPTFLAVRWFLRESSTVAASPGFKVAPVAYIRLGQKVEANQMNLVNQNGDGSTAVTEVEGVSCHAIASEPGLPPAYFYFQLDSKLKLRQAPVLVAVEYFDATSGTMSIDYDSVDENSRNPAYTRSATRVELRKDNRWHKAVFLLEYPRFQHGMHDGGDFRIALSGSRLFLRSVEVAQ